jgi:hypothetical protein
MIEELDKTIAAFLKSGLPQDIGSRVIVSFATPDSQFPPAGMALPAVNLFLYNVGESADLRDNAPSVQRLPNGTAYKSRPPVYLECSYLVTVWPDPKIENPAADEHTIMSAVTKVLLAHPALPDDLLQGSLQNSQTAPVAAKLSRGEFRSPGEIWQALGGRQKLSLNYTVTFGMPVFEAEQATLVREKQIRFNPSVAVDSQ